VRVLSSMFFLMRIRYDVVFVVCKGGGDDLIVLYLCVLGGTEMGRRTRNCCSRVLE